MVSCASKRRAVCTSISIIFRFVACCKSLFIAGAASAQDIVDAVKGADPSIPTAAPPRIGDAIEAVRKLMTAITANHVVLSTKRMSLLLEVTALQAGTLSCWRRADPRVIIPAPLCALLYHAAL